MSIRREVTEFAGLGPLPDQDADEATIARHQDCLSRIVAPVADAEAAVLIELFGPDDCYGLAWTLLHLIESAPAGAPLNSEPGSDANEWVRCLWSRAHR